LFSGLLVVFCLLFYLIFCFDRAGTEEKIYEQEIVAVERRDVFCENIQVFSILQRYSLHFCKEKPCPWIQDRENPKSEQKILAFSFNDNMVLLWSERRKEKKMPSTHYHCPFFLPIHGRVTECFSFFFFFFSFFFLLSFFLFSFSFFR